MNSPWAIVALAVIVTACSDAGERTNAFHETPFQPADNGEPLTPLKNVQASFARSSNEYVLGWCRDGASYAENRCKQHLRGRMRRFSCDLTVSYDEVRTRWIASYDQPGRFEMTPDDAFFAFLEDADFCEPIQPNPATNNIVRYSSEDAWGVP